MSYSREKKDDRAEKIQGNSSVGPKAFEVVEAEPIPIPTMKELLSSPEALAKCDIAVLNLLYAQGLPGSQNLDIQKCVRLLDRWAEHTRRETTKYLSAFYRDPKIGDNSEAKYRMLIMAAVLVEDMKCGYNMDLVTSGSMAYACTSRVAQLRQTCLLPNIGSLIPPPSGNVLLHAANANVSISAFFTDKKNNTGDMIQ